MERIIKVAAVSYLNSKPLIRGIEQHPVFTKIELITDYPAKIAQALTSDTVDMGLVPVAVIPSLKNAQLIGNYGIASDSQVASVCIFSQVPIENITELYLDYQSRTSVRLAQLLLKLYWKKEVKLLAAPSDYIENIQGNRAGVIIGDRAMLHANDFPYVYDLAEHWRAFTGLPFIFAAWIANKSLPGDFIAEFNAANQLGVQCINQVIAEYPDFNYDLQHYFAENIQFALTEERLKGLELFLQYLNTYQHELV